MASVKPGGRAILIRLLLGFCLVANPWAGAAAQLPDQRPFAAVVADWNLSLDWVERRLQRETLAQQASEDLKEQLAEVREAAERQRGETEPNLRALRGRLMALGPPPAEGESPEIAELATERQKINDEIAQAEGHITQAELVIQRTEELAALIDVKTRGAAIELLLDPHPWPLAPGTVVAALPEMARVLSQLGQTPVNWWDDLAEADRGGILFQLGSGLLFALVLGFGLRFALMRWLGRRPEIEHPTYARRFYAGVAEGLALGMVPTAILGVILYRIVHDIALVTGELAEVIQALSVALIFFIVTWALTHAVLAPGLPQWRLVNLPPREARMIGRIITFLAGIFAIDLFFQVWGGHLGGPRPFLSFHAFVLTATESLGILALMRGWLWQLEPESTAADATVPAATEPDAAGPLTAARFWLGLRLVISALALAAIAAALIGYANLGVFLSNRLLVTGVAVGLLFLLRGLFRELIGAVTRAAFLRERLAVSHRARQLIKFWARALLDAVIFAAGFLTILGIWGVPFDDLWSWTVRVLSGFKVGDVTISITDAVAALFVFLAVLFVSRILQQLLTERVLPRTRLDSGLRNSLSAGFGYLGLVVALLLGTTALGLDLTNLALIFGALSVGIGFGLQNVANNFVSGLILLVERPVKVGDWVIVGNHEGTVKRIRLRSTEIETFQRASIIIPNSDLISSAVTNWTHRDSFGRLDVPVGVAYGSDVEQVKTILLQAMKDHERILSWPEPFVLFQAFGDSALEFEVRGYLSDIGYIIPTNSDVMTSVEKGLRDAGIEVPLPQRVIHLRDIDRLEAAFAGRPRPTQRKAKARHEPAASPERDPRPDGFEEGGTGDGE